MSPAAPGWHALLGPIPAHARPRLSPVATPELLASGQAAPVADWSSLILELSTAAGELRIVQVLLDGEGRALSASDHVLFRSPPADPGGRPWMRQDNIGGRFEADGSFRGTCWRVEGPEPEDDEPPRWSATSRPPEEAEIAALRKLVAQLMARRPGIAS